MTRAVIVGSGSEIAPTRVTNAQMARIMDTSDDWIRERSGVEARHFANPGDRHAPTSAWPPPTKALGGGRRREGRGRPGRVRHHDPRPLLPRLRHAPAEPSWACAPVPCFDIRQQCSGFLYGLQLADAHIRAGMAKTVLLVGAEVHIGFMPWTRENFAYALGELGRCRRRRRSGTGTRVSATSSCCSATRVRPSCCARPRTGRAGVVDQELHGAGADYEKLYVPGTGFKHRPYTDPEQFRRGDHIPVMDGRYVFKMATTNMVEVARSVMQKNGVAPADLKLVLMHQANKRINEYCAKTLGLREEQVPHNIHKYGNTTAATIPLLWDECTRDGRL